MKRMIKMKLGRGKLYRLFLLTIMVILGRLLIKFYYWQRNSLYDASKIDSNSLYLWSVDFHAAPIACNKEILESAGSTIHAEVDFSNCIYFPWTCKKRLKVLSFDGWRGFSLDPCPGRLKRQFFEAYKEDPEFSRVDVFICSHPVANCELFLPFNKSMIVYATTRIEFGRWDANIDWRLPYITDQSRSRWKAWLNNLAVLASNERNIIAANNLYDLFAIEYYTGIKALYLPSWCGSDDPKLSSKTPHGDEGVSGHGNSDDDKFTVIIGPYRDFSGGWNHSIFEALRASLQVAQSRYKFERQRDIYPTYKSLHILQRHPCIVLIPYQVSFMSFFEYYRQGIPIYVPSKAFLLAWDHNYDIMAERIYGNVERESLLHSTNMRDSNSRWFSLKRNDYQRVDAKLIPSHDFAALTATANISSLPNPSLKSSLASWIHFCDFYIFPHVQTFDSWPQLISMIESNDASGRHEEISLAMDQFSRRQKINLIEAWKMIFDELKQDREPGSSTVPSSFQAGLEAFYGESNLPVMSLNENVDKGTCSNK